MKSKVIIGIVIVVVVIAAVLIIKKNKNETPQLPVQDMSITLTDGVYKLENNISLFSWTAKKIAGGHTGIVALKSGTITVVDGSITAGNVVVDMTTLAAPKDDDNQKLSEHLKSADFFDVVKNPTATLTVSSLKKTDTDFVLTGDVAIKGTTKRIEIPVVVSNKQGNLVIDGKFPISAKDFGIISNKTYETVINDSIELSFTTIWKSTK